MIALGQFLEVLIGGLMSGVLYSLVALGFVLIFKASGVFNFAQGSMVFFAAMTFVGLQQESGLSVWFALPVTLGAMVVLGLVIERIASSDALYHIANTRPWSPFASRTFCAAVASSEPSRPATGAILFWLR